MCEVLFRGAGRSPSHCLRLTPLKVKIIIGGGGLFSKKGAACPLAPSQVENLVVRKKNKVEYFIAAPPDPPKNNTSIQDGSDPTGFK